jgi:hypothetical protein
MDNGRILFQRGMEAAGYSSIGGGLPPPGTDIFQRGGVGCVDVGFAVESWRPRVVIMWPRYEWDPMQWKGPEVTAAHCFTNLEPLIARDDVLRVAVLHDAGSDRKHQRRWHEFYKPHVYLCWYHPKTVCKLNPHVRPEQIVRTWHIIDAEAAAAALGSWAPVAGSRQTACLAGHPSTAIYPFRSRAMAAAKAGTLGEGVECLEHPGYHQRGTTSNGFIARLAGYKVCIVGGSRYGFALRKHIEATAAGCIVITDLPEYDRLPHIDGNLIRVPTDISTTDLRTIVQGAAADWDPEAQGHYAEEARDRYGHYHETARLAQALAERASSIQHPASEPSP